MEASEATYAVIEKRVHLKGATLTCLQGATVVFSIAHI